MNNIISGAVKNHIELRRLAMSSPKVRGSMVFVNGTRIGCVRSISQTMNADDTTTVTLTFDVHSMKGFDHE